MDRHTKHICHIFLLSLLLASFIGATAASDRVVVTSGRVVYDAFGRVIKTYHPTVDCDTVTSFSCDVDTEPPTVTEYDVLDRPVKVTYPDSTFTETAYGVAGHVQVVTVTDALGNVSKTHVDGSGRTVKSIRFESPVSQDSIVTEFTYDGIGRLVEVMDADSNVTVSEYDMGDRRVRVVHPASGETTFTYDALGNVLTKQTANLRDSTAFIVYGYDRGRLISVSYPGHPENDVHYYYGGANDQDKAKGRLCFRRDATGGEQYAYDNLGNVKKTLRTVTVPNEAVVTFKTEFEYDSYGKLLSLTYPDEEMVCYWYDGSGQLTEIYTGDRADCHHYVHEIGYDKFGDRVYMRYGNGTETSYRYDNMRRLDTLSVSKPGQFSLFRIYEYDDVGNIIKLTNTNTGSPLLYPPVIHRYEYDGLYRLTAAHGNETDPQTGYDLSMSYDDMYRITGKTQTIRQTGIQFPGTLNAGYDLAYTYDRTPGRRFRMSSVSDVNYRTEGDPVEGDLITEEHFYEYDPNGNILRVNTSRVRADGGDRELTREEKFRWDDENRLTSISQNGYVSNYWYDADGERVIKEHGGNHAVFVNGSQDSVLTDTRQFTIYPSAYLVVHNGGWYTKHIYIGTERVSSRMGSVQGKLKESFEANVLAGRNVLPRISYGGQCDTMALVMKSNYEYFGLPYNGKNRRANSMVSTEPWDGSELGQLPGGLRYYCMPGDAEETVTGGEGGPSGAPRRAKKVDGDGKFYYYHSDHLGSSSLITDSVGNVTQQVEYLPYGEVFLEKRSTDQNVNYFTPYRFNGKELDEETGLYYYGARYMNPRLSIWYAIDQLELVSPNISTYTYCKSNPISFGDPTGNGWIEQNHKYFYDPRVTNQNKAIELYGNTATYLFEAGELYATNHSYSYNLEYGGHVRNTFTGEFVTGEFTTKGGSTIVNNNQYLSQKKLSLIEKWSSSDNIFAQLSYETLNDLYVGLQIISMGAFERQEWKNPFTGACFGNLDGTPNYNQIEAIPGLATEILPISSAAPQGVKLLNKLNAAEFSKTFKGNLSKLKPKTRGHVNRTINSKIDKANQYIGSGKIVLDATSLVKNDENQ